MAEFTDQTNHTIAINHSPQRIISLVPSQTELLYDLGLENEVIGITRFCIHPQVWFKTKQRVGGTKQVKMDLIRQLQPDLIIANKEENVKEQVEALQQLFPVWTSDINSLADAYSMINSIGSITGKSEASKQLISRIQDQFATLKPLSPPPSACYLIWQDPFMTVGNDTFIHVMMQSMGLRNIFEGKKRYPSITLDQLREQSPAILLLSSEPFPFGDKHVKALQPLLPKTRILLVDGEMFSWYGSRLQYAPAYFSALQSRIINNAGFAGVINLVQ